MAGEGEDAGAAASAAPKADTPPPAPPKAPGPPKADATPKAPEPPAAPTPPAAPAAPAPHSEGDRVKASPLARRLAQAQNIDLGSIQGSGPGGRVVRADIDAAVGKAPAA